MYMRSLFGKKCCKIPIDAGFTCPNIDGTKGIGGCIYCANGSRSVITDTELDPVDQFKTESIKYRQKYPDCLFVPYFQSFSCTYADVKHLKSLYDPFTCMTDVVGIAIGTRADCLTKENTQYLASLAKKTHLTVELGLQTVSDNTANLINRRHTFNDFLTGYQMLRKASPEIRIGIHIISGLPGETIEDEIKTAKAVASMRPDEIKIHLLHVLEGTVLANMYKNGEYKPLDFYDYIERVCKILEIMPPQTVIGRLTGDGDRSLLLAPLYSRDKKRIINEIDKTFYKRNTYQGILYNSEERI